MLGYWKRDALKARSKAAIERGKRLWLVDLLALAAHWFVTRYKMRRLCLQILDEQKSCAARCEAERVDRLRNPSKYLTAS